jgi:hypothetical protein
MKKTTDKNVPVCVEQHQQLLVVKNSTGASITFVIGLAIAEWLEKHCPVNSVAGKALLDADMFPGKREVKNVT